MKSAMLLSVLFAALMWPGRVLANTGQTSVASGEDNSFEARQNAGPTNSVQVKVDLSTPEKAAQEFIKAVKERDANRYWACTSKEFRTEIVGQIGGTEKEALDYLRNEMRDDGKPRVTAGKIVSKLLSDDTHCTLQLKWAMEGQTSELPSPLYLVKEDNEWRIPKRN